MQKELSMCAFVLYGSICELEAKRQCQSHRYEPYSKQPAEFNGELN